MKFRHFGVLGASDAGVARGGPGSPGEDVEDRVPRLGGWTGG